MPCTYPDSVDALENDFSGLEIITASQCKVAGAHLNPTLLLSVFLKNHLCFRRCPPTMRQAVISVILKKEKNPLNCNSFRPISLLNTDAKILAKVLPHRLDGVLPSIISPDQTG